MLYCFSPKLFRNQEIMTVESYVAWTEECLFHNLSEVYGREDIDHDVRVPAVENATSFYSDALIV